MSVSIKLSRTGSKNNILYRVIASPTKSKRDGKNLAILGSYNPKFKKLDLDKGLFEEWVKKGAILTQGVKKIINK